MTSSKSPLSTNATKVDDDLDPDRQRCHQLRPLQRLRWVRQCRDFSYQAQSWKIPRRVLAKVEWHPGELYPRVG
jgi:hypothetical protein